MIHPLTEHRPALQDQVYDLERLCARLQATIRRQAALLKQKRGVRRGHKGRIRPLVPTDEVDAIVDCKPERCCACAHLLTGDDPSPWRHQVSEIPEPRIEITACRRHHLSCPNCGRVTIGALPEGVSHSSCEPRLYALTSLLTGRFLLRKRDVVTRYDVVYGLQLGASSVIAMEGRMTEALADPVQEALEWARSAPVVHPDETSLRQAKERAPAAKTRRECAALLKTEDRMWTFVDIDAMDPTNNLAERSVRRRVLWRKKSFGTDSEAGGRIVAHIRSVVTTMHLQQQPIFEFLVETRESHVRGSGPPSLCPTT